MILKYDVVIYAYQKIVALRGIVLKVISSKYSVYMLAITIGIDSFRIAISSFRYMSDPKCKYIICRQNVNISISLSLGIVVCLPSSLMDFILSRTIQRASSVEIFHNRLTANLTIRVE